MSWSTWKPSKSEPWNVLRVVHLHRRAGFGATWAEIQRDLKDSPDAAIDRVIAPPSAETIEQHQALMKSVGDAAVGSNDPKRLQAWWFVQMLKTRHPLTEKLTLMWHNHFATSNNKVLDLAAMRRQNEIFRRHASGKFVDLLTAVIHDPAMLVWLDATLNRKGRPNENLAREVMELFTIGVGNYSEADIREAARALTGWAIKDGQFTKQNRYHDDGSKTIFGQQGTFDGDDLLRILWQHPATAKRIAWRICDTFMGENAIDDAAIDDLAKQLRESQLDVGKAVETVLRSENFFSEKNIGTRVASPVEFVMCNVLSCEISPPSSRKLAHWSSELGQEVFYPPNVGGWSGGRNWLSTRQVVARANFAAALADGKLTTKTKAINLAKLTRHAKSTRDGVVALDQLLLGGRLDESSQMQIVSAVDDAKIKSSQKLRYALGLLLSMPESQLC